jgi:hypothetical protein
MYPGLIRSTRRGAHDEYPQMGTPSEPRAWLPLVQSGFGPPRSDRSVIELKSAQATSGK